MKKMRKVCLLLTVIITIQNALGQGSHGYYYDVNFDDTVNIEHVFIESNSSWQIGTPNKSTINTAESIPRALITDSINPYGVNDTSSFIFYHINTGEGFWGYHTVELRGRYWVDTDSLNDFGYFEFSPDNGQSWINLMTDTFYIDNVFIYYSGPRVFTGSSALPWSNWQWFSINVAPMAHLMSFDDGDTLLFKFTFISDSILDNRDGIAFDNLGFADYTESIEEHFLRLNLCPNPTSSSIKLELERELHKGMSELYSISGQLILSQQFTGSMTEIDLSLVEAGSYILIIKDGNTVLGREIVVKE
jgi:hypothetical protein